ncbi:ribosomal protein l34 domain-containing protein [Purpureocillium lavendulum]|uniref:Ribosomal protein l34 domain-containing protein n=1 Tax=Purpureocillium lavendulum TaxID=1247861 RepID=A0AB34FN17_9HYPO|nr:ribosomal protein l34 domain-containing protein [Purpureocillium lavendulum]
MQSLTRLARPLLSKPLSSARCAAAPPPLAHGAAPVADPVSRRTFTTLSPLRPSLTPLRRPGALTSFTPAPTPATSVTPGGVAADVVPAGAVSSHPAFGGALQMRFGPRNTMNGHTRLVQKRRHGFLYRMKSKTGRRILMRRRIKGRRNVAW